MKIGIIVHSFSGNTYSVALKLQDKLTKAGHNVTVEQLKLVGGEKKDTREFKLENPPDISSYEGVIFGAPVRAFSVSPVLAAYINQLSSLANKKTACFVTKALRYKWTGGNRAISWIKKNCEAKGANVAGTAIISWNSKSLESEIAGAVDNLSKIY